MSLRLVIDCSGSMAGESIKSARRGAMRVLEALTDADEVSITRFGTTFEHFDQRLTKAVSTSPSSVRSITCKALTPPWAAPR
jgi:Ca-activated chloride channel homolog